MKSIQLFSTKKLFLGIILGVLGIVFVAQTQHAFAAPLNFYNTYISADLLDSWDVDTADLDGDGILDLYISNNVNSQINKLWLGNGDGTFTNSDIPGNTGQTLASELVDIDGDGDIDIVNVNYQQANKLLINDGLGNGGASFTILNRFGSSGLSVDAGDVDGDGDIDVAVGHPGGLYLNNGSEVFAKVTLTGDSIGSYGVSLFDIDSDGDLDVYKTRYDATAQNRLWINDGLGNGASSFTVSNIVGDVGPHTQGTLIDIDNDGDMDLHVARGGQNNLWINDGLGNGGASFTASNITGDAGGSSHAAVVDIDNDGDMDMYIPNGNNNQNNLLINDGLGNGGASFTLSNITGDLDYSKAAVAFDADNDGDIDIYVANYSNRRDKLWIQNPLPVITITAPTHINNGPITDTTVVVTDDQGVLAADVILNPTTTATVSSFLCTQIDAKTVNCTMQIDTTGKIVIKATDDENQFSIVNELGYVIDTTPPQVPSVSMSLPGGTDPDNPTFTFSALDNIAIDYFTITYNTNDGLGGSIGPVTTVVTTSPITLSLDPDGTITAPNYHEVIVTVYDTAGNASSTTIRFTPIVSFTAPTTISNTTISDATVTITSPSGNNLGSLTLDEGGTSASGLTCPGDLGGGVYASPVTCTLDGIVGTGTITVYATDEVTGATGQNPQSFIIETNPASLVVLAPTKSDSGVITDTTITIQDDIAINAADITMTAVNTTGAFSVSNLACTQVNASQVTCTLQVDANTGTGDIQFDITDVAGNTTTVTETGYVVDVTAPAAPAQAPDMISASDTGVSNTDDQTNQDTPTFDIVCSESDAEIKLFIDGALVEAYTCTALGTASITLSSGLSDGSYDVTYTETDAFGNESTPSPVLTIIIDTTITATTVNAPTNGSPVSGTGEPSSPVTITTPSGATCTTTTDVGGNYSCVLVPAPLDGENITVTITDDYGNISNPTAVAGIDTAAPTTPVINPVSPDATSITGTGENGTTIVLTDITCDNTPIIVAAGIWECVNPQPALVAGQMITATATDSAGNISVGTYTIPRPSSAKGGKKKTPEQVAAIFGTTTSTVIPTTSNPFGGTQCPAHLLITDNMKQGNRNNVYSSYNQGIVTQIGILQTHMNRLLLDEYGNQASGPIDGIFGPLTKQGVMRLQTRLNQLLPTMTPLVIDGIVGTFTKAAINMSCVQE